MRTALAVCLTLLCLAALPAPAAAATLDPRIDRNTGRDQRIWPPDTPFEHHHMRLEIGIPDMSRSFFEAVQTITLSARAAPRAAVQLDASDNLDIAAITLDGRPLGFTHEDNTLLITLPRPAAPQEPFDLVINYSTDNPGGAGAGLTWSDTLPRDPDSGYMFHSQGQPQSNHLWFPCHDFPNVRASTELIVTVPDGYEAVSNGRLLSIARLPGGARTFHWRQDKPHVYYLVALIVGRFDVVNVGGPETAYPGLWMPVYGPPGSGESIRAVFANTPEMIAYFEDLLAFPFPWDKYAQLIVRDFAAGAMENTSAVTFHAAFSRGRRGTHDGIIAHELVHHWFGNVVTCRSWEHLWLNEGWASLGEALWAEHKGGREAYMRSIQSKASMARFVEPALPVQRGMVSNLYNNPYERFMAPDNVYMKGAVVLHMLRMRLGDEAFFEGARLFLRRHAYSQADTEDFRRAMEEVSGQSLERFFEQWMHRSGAPRLAVDLEWDDGYSRLSITVEQTQRIDANNPAFAFSLPIYLEFEDHPARYVYIHTDKRAATGTFDLPAMPANVLIDPNIHVLADSRIRTRLPRVEAEPEPAAP